MYEASGPRPSRLPRPGRAPASTPSWMSTPAPKPVAERLLSEAARPGPSVEPPVPGPTPETVSNYLLQAARPPAPEQERPSPTREPRTNPFTTELLAEEGDMPGVVAEASRKRQRQWRAAARDRDELLAAQERLLPKKDLEVPVMETRTAGSLSGRGHVSFQAPTGETKMMIQGPYLQDVDAHAGTDAVESKAHYQDRFKHNTSRTSRMTMEEYNALSENQRAAIDFNGMLLQAVRKDRRNRDTYDPDAESKEIYDKAVKNVFGDGRTAGSGLYAPETVSLLQQLDLKWDDADLDDFLSLDRAITSTDVDRMDEMLKQNLRTPSTEQAQRTAALREELYSGEWGVDTLQRSARAERSKDSVALGGTPNNVRLPIGFQPGVFDEQGNPEDLNSHFIKGFDLLARQGLKPSEVASLRNAIYEPLSEEERSMFDNYVDTRIRLALENDLKLGQTEGAKYRKPEEFEKLFSRRKKE